jgi:outer membrane protein
MKKLILPLLALATLSAGSIALHAQPAVKLVTVSMDKVFDSHWKSEEANIKFQNADKKAQEQVEELKKQGQTLVEEYKELVEQAKNTLLTAEARTKAEGDAAKKYEEIQRKQTDIQSFVQNTQRSLQQRISDHRDMLLEEISKIVVEIARKHDATLVLDKSGPSIFKIPVVLYSDPAYDITAEVIVQENKDRPVAPVAAPAAAPTAAAPLTVPGAPAPKPAAPQPATPAPKK